MNRRPWLDAGRGITKLVADFGHQLPGRVPVAAAGGRRPLRRAGRQARPGCQLGGGGGAAGGLPDDLGDGRRRLAADRRRRAATDRGADGPGLAVRRSVLRRPDRLDDQRHCRRHEPEHYDLRGAGPRQVRHRQGLLPAADDLRLPHPDPRRRQGRNEPLCRALGVAPHAVGHGLPARINPLDFGPLGNDWTRLPAAEAQRRAALVFSRWLLRVKGPARPWPGPGRCGRSAEQRPLTAASGNSRPTPPGRR